MRVALTLDTEHPDRPGGRRGVHDRVLAGLSDAGARVTAFLQGRWVQAYPEAARRIAETGHLVGSHSHFHARMSLLTDAGIRHDLAEAERVIEATTGRSPRPWLRLPWADGARDPRVRAAVEAAGYRAVGWDVVAQDGDLGPQEVERSVLAGVEAFGDGAVVLLHAWPQATLRALPGIVRGLRSLGAALVMVADLGDRDLSETADPQAVSRNPTRLAGRPRLNDDSNSTA
jgi:peptidoglycan-N-acetylglucosamine deacetylase